MAKSIKDTRRSKTIVVAFGRFQPPTSGHQLLFNKVVDTAHKMGADHAIGFSRSHDPKKNPLSPSRKYFWLKRLFPGVHFLNSEKIKTPFDLLYQLAEMGYDHVVFVGGEDRSEDYDDKTIRKLMKHSDPKRRLNLKRYDFVMAGKRDAKASGVQGMSASKMRAAVAEDNKKAFARGMPSAAGRDDVVRLFDDLKRGMRTGMKEEFDFTELYHTAAANIIESDKHKRRPPTPGQTGGFSKHNTQFPTPPCKIDEDAHDQIDEDAGCPSNSRGAENTWVSVSRGRVQFYVGKASQPCQTFGDGTILSAIRYGEEVYCALKNGRTAIYVIKNGRMIYGPVRIV